MKGSIDSGQVSTLTTAMTNLGTNTSETKTKMEELS
jgi:hypothetical protein